MTTEGAAECDIRDAGSVFNFPVFAYSPLVLCVLSTEYGLILSSQWGRIVFVSCIYIYILI